MWLEATILERVGLGYMVIKKNSPCVFINGTITEFGVVNIFIKSSLPIVRLKSSVAL